MENRYNPHREQSDTHPETGTRPTDADVEAIGTESDPEQALAAEAIKKNPKAVFEHVIAAAQRKEALERVYELRQEVKDEPAALPPADDDDEATEDDHTEQQIAEQPVSFQLPTYPEQTYHQSAVQPSQAVHDTPHDNVSSRHHSSMYRTAVRTGFAAAIVLLTLFIIAIVLVS